MLSFALVLVSIVVTWTSDTLVEDAVIISSHSEPDEHGLGDVSISPHLGDSDAQAGGSFDYHKSMFPLDLRDYVTFLCAGVGLVLAASGGIGGGGILVPLYIIMLKFNPKHAVALSNFTILGGAIANTAFNVRKKDARRPGGLIDWDLILAMEPLTIFGAVFGALLSKVLPNILLTTCLVAILLLMGHRTMTKGMKMWKDESGRAIHAGQAIELGAAQDFDNAMQVSLASDNSRANPLHGSAGNNVQKVGLLTLCFIGVCVATILKGGGNFDSPLGLDCGSVGFWILYFCTAPWVLVFAWFFRQMLMREHEQKLTAGYVFFPDEVQWNSYYTLRYPLICSLAGLCAGLFGVGGGIVKGPLMLEMGISPAVASATAATMILYTAAAASVSFMVFGLLEPSYSGAFFVLGLVCTALGQFVVNQVVAKYNRQSPIVLSIGSVILLSSLLIGSNTIISSLGKSLHELLQGSSICGTDVG